VPNPEWQVCNDLFASPISLLKYGQYHFDTLILNI